MSIALAQTYRVVKTLIVLSVLILVLHLSGCTVFTYYHPTNTMPPKVEEKSDFQVAGGLGVSEQFENYSLEMNYQYDSVHYAGIQVYLAEDHFVTSSGSNVEKISNYFELLHGRHYRINEHLLYYHTYGFGYGNTFNRYETGFKSLDYVKPNVKTALSINTSVVDFGFGAQLSGLYFFDIVDLGRHWAVDTEYERDLENLREDPFCMTFQPYVHLGLGWKKLKIVAQYSYSDFLIGGHRIKHDNEYFSLGITYTFPNSFTSNRATSY